MTIYGMNNPIIKEFSSLHPGHPIKSREFVLHLLKLWNNGWHKDVADFIEDPDIVEQLYIINTINNDKKFDRMINLVNEYIPFTRNKLGVESNTEKLIRIAYTQNLPVDINEIKSKKLSYHLLLFYYVFTDDMISAWKVFDKKISSILKNGSKYKVDLDINLRYLDELINLINKTFIPDYLEIVNKNSLLELIKVFSICFYEVDYYPKSSIVNLSDRIIKLLVCKKMYEHALDFYCTYKEYFDLNNTNTVTFLSELAQKTQNYEDVNILFGDIQTIQSRILKYYSRIDEKINRVKNLILEGKEIIEQNRSFRIYRDRYEFFFFECEIYNDCVSDHTKLSNYQKEVLLKKLLDAAMCFYRDNKDLTSPMKKRMEPEFPIMVGYNFGKKVLQFSNEILVNIPGNLETPYRNKIINEIIPELQTTLLTHYLSQMSDLVNQILNQRGERLLEKWDIEMSKKQFEDVFKNVNLEDYSKYNNTNLYERNRFMEANSRTHQLWVYPDVQKLLTTGEWAWRNLSHSFSDNNDENGQELTYIVANYLKAVEIFITFKLIEIKTKVGDIPSISVSKDGGGFEYVSIGSEQFLKKFTLGNFIRYLRVDCRNNQILKERVIRSNVIEYMEDWTNRVRNSHFHKDTITSIYTTQTIRTDTIVLLKRLIADLL